MNRKKCLRMMKTESCVNLRGTLLFQCAINVIDYIVALKVNRFRDSGNVSMIFAHTVGMRMIAA